eukprot:3987823-Amphidinium_carterae.1
MSSRATHLPATAANTAADSSDKGWHTDDGWMMTKYSCHAHVKDHAIDSLHTNGNIDAEDGDDDHYMSTDWHALVLTLHEHRKAQCARGLSHFCNSLLVLNSALRIGKCTYTKALTPQYVGRSRV